MIENSKKIGVIVAVDGDSSQVGMYSLTNDVEYIWRGEILTGPRVGAYLTINQNDIKIIASVASEKIIDTQNNVKSEVFDNRFSKGTVKRILTLKTKGVIEKNKFTVTSQYVPMIGNEISITTKKELNIIYGVEAVENSISIGTSILENQPIHIPINSFFPSHIGIFGNTGSGKSNTLHKLYLELFRTKYKKMILQTSQFFIIDFNGEYTSENMFGINQNNKCVFNINTRIYDKSDMLPIKEEYILDPEILSILFDARPATQVPFLRQALRLYKEVTTRREFKFGNFVAGTLKKILTSGNSSSQDSLNNWIETAKKYCDNNDDIFLEIDKLQFNSSKNCYYYENTQGKIFYNTGSENSIPSFNLQAIGLDTIIEKLNEKFTESDNLIDRLLMFLDFQKEHRTAWDKVNREHLIPLFNRIYSSLDSLKKVVLVIPEISDFFKCVNIINLINANQEIKRLIPMLLSKMIYDEQKKLVSSNVVNNTKHLIIDEAHNILNSELKNIGDSWQDYRLSIFEEIIKEGRKFGFYLTLSSQRPADISPTIMSQLHNYLIHRLVNEKDLRMLESTMPTLDKTSYNMISMLGKGETILTGKAIKIPVFVKVEKENKIRPTSDDVVLTDIWANDTQLKDWNIEF
ncbi:ATP-binding protein [uncultured Granulicatella sp.]|uniref:ATP-binding protein n=1 Tax=uncultured Granulicatella sp. TaxID=316089 RepID=UPI0028D3D5A2|nr:ATP-binding protein [uncultured Granulicatella sp.]